MLLNNQTNVSKNVVISGGARGIGRALTRYFLEAGHKVYVFDIDEDELEYTVKVHLKTHHDEGRLAYATCNLRDVDDIRTKVEAAAAGDLLGGVIDVLVNNGGIASPYWRDGKTMEDPDTIGEWRAYVDTNLTGPFAMSQACVPFMKARRADAVDGARTAEGGATAAPAGPCILLIGSFRAHQSDPNQEGYAASKAGQLGLTHSMAVSLGALGIRVNLIAPGRIKVGHESREGDEAGRSWGEQVLDKDVDDHPTNRAGRPKDIADAALYLMDAGFVTGQDLVVDGGALRKKN
ncbi:short chain dehydrogenase [Colletotrichum zoysiae]|uniref:Short chain dehydrogenase n=1 Tax=Colletotrichum zoysiae TaxID=1216348 RepID=A0AAD9M6B9_9PEZI|nr:short chain dehydrogenase [Colletotrichum zoysiae]